MDDLLIKKGIKAITLIDFETTGLSPEGDYPIEVAVKKLFLDCKKEIYSEMIKLPEGIQLPEFIVNYTGLTTETVNEKGVNKDVVKLVLEDMIDDNTLVVAHNANFDLGFLYHHFSIKPKHFLCTRTIEFLTNPHLSSSLEATYKRYVGEVEQEHRALADVEMMLSVLREQSSIHGGAMEFFFNKMVITPERGLVYQPDNAIVLDFDQLFQLKK